MNQKFYRTQSTSTKTALVNDIELSISPAGKTRKILRPDVIDNSQDKSKCVKIAIIHQKRANAKEPWQKIDALSLNQVKVGEAAQMSLDTSETFTLFNELKNIYPIGENGIQSGERVVMVGDTDTIVHVPAQRAQVIKKLLSAQHGEEFWENLVVCEPDLASRLALSRVYDDRKRVIDEFESYLPQDLTEPHWQSFLDRNKWIFGTNYIGFIHERRINLQSTLDYPLLGEDGCLEVVEIKKPSFHFWKQTKSNGPFLYRDKYLVPHGELNAALTQGSNYILEIEKKMDSIEWQNTHGGISPLKPRCLVIHGRSEGWGKLEHQEFRLLNDRLHGIAVITFDHLLSRAKRALEVFRVDSNLTE